MTQTLRSSASICGKNTATKIQCDERLSIRQGFRVALGNHGERRRKW